MPQLDSTGGEAPHFTRDELMEILELVSEDFPGHQGAARR